jgi:hypothetical protein
LKWEYNAVEELKTEKHPAPKRAVIVAKITGKEIGQPLKILVKPVFLWLTTFHQHGPGLIAHAPTDADYNQAWKYAKWKYDIKTNFLRSILFARDQTQSGLTKFGGGQFQRDCTLGFGAFSSENLCASTLGHENLHGRQPDIMFRPIWFVIHPIDGEKLVELPAYRWEKQNATRTGLSAIELAEVDAWINYFLNGGPRPQ